MTRTNARGDVQRTPLGPPADGSDAGHCANCASALVGEYCAACGQRAIDFEASTWHLAKEAFEDATDINGRVLRTARALASPGRLTVEFLRGRRVPYVGPFKLLLLAGTALTSTWIFTRGIDAHYYGYAPDRSAGSYIDGAVRGSLCAVVAIAFANWAFDRGRRRLLDQLVVAMHIVASISLYVAAVVWIGTGWKVVWGTVGATPRSIPSIVYVLFLPAVCLAACYIVVATRRVYGLRWWVATLRGLLMAALGAAAVMEAITHLR